LNEKCTLRGECERVLSALNSQVLRTISPYYHIHPSIQSWTFSRIESSTTHTHTKHHEKLKTWK